MAYYIPETWSKIGKLFNYPFIYGRGLDARPGNMGGGAMEINTVQRRRCMTPSKPGEMVAPLAPDVLTRRVLGNQR